MVSSLDEDDEDDDDEVEETAEESDSDGDPVLSADMFWRQLYKDRSSRKTDSQ